MNRDGRDSDDADWLLAQLVSGHTPARQDPPVAPPPAVVPPVAEKPVAPRVVEPGPRREEVLDWFSLAGPASASDAATRALPVIGAPSAAEPVRPPAIVPPVAQPVVPPVAAPPPAAAAGPAAPAAAAGPAAPAAAAGPAAPVGLPAWNPPFTVGRPGAVPLHTPPPPTSPLTVVEPPVVPSPPPGPVTPTAQFALTWGAGDLDSEDAIREAFRNLSAPGSTAPAERPEPEPQPPAAASAGPASPPAAATPPAIPPAASASVPPRHPIAPATAPAGWDERAARPAPRTDFDDEIWSALTEADPEAPIASPSATTPARPAAPVPPAWPIAAAAPVAEPATPPAPAAPSSTPSTPSNPSQATGFPFIEVRGEADSRVSEIAGFPAAETAANRRAPFPAFASTGGDDGSRQPDPQPGEPVDDLLAALGAGTARPTGDGRGGDAATDRGGASGSVPPERGGTPPTPPTDDGLDVLGLGFSDDDDDDDDAAEVTAAAAAAAAATAAAAVEPESTIAREIAETGYFWNLTPDPTAADPKAEPLAEESAVPSPFDRPSPFAADEYDASVVVDDAAAFDEPAPEPQPEPEPEPEPVPEPEPGWSFGDETLTAMFPPAAAPAEPAAPTAALPTANAEHDDDPLAALFGAPAAPQPEAPWPGAGTPASPAARHDVAAAFAAAPVTRAANPARVAGPAHPPSTPPPHIAAAGGTGRPTGTGGGAGASGGSGGNRTVRTLLWIAGGLVVAVVLAGLFYLGTQLTGGGGAGEAPSAAPSETETPVAEPTAPQPVGVHAWNTLFGGECLDPFESAWAEEFSVVDCGAPHAAQLVYRGELAGDAAAPFPGEAEVAAQMNGLCTAPGIIDIALVAGIPDLQVQASFPVTEEQWSDGERIYYCFANRSGGEALTASITGPGPAA